MKFEIFATVKMSVLVCWVVTMCGLMGRYQRFGESTFHFFTSSMQIIAGRILTSYVHCSGIEPRRLCVLIRPMIKLIREKSR